MSDLSGDELADVEKRYRDSKPTMPCHTCGGTEWSLAGCGRGRETWVCKVANDARPMNWSHYSASEHEVMSGDDDVLRLIAEIRRHRERRLDESDRVRLRSIIALLNQQPMCWDMEAALLSRLIGDDK